jgi:ferredoxin
MIVQNNSCVGDNSCSFTKGFTTIDSSSCIGVSACSRLTLGTISEEACQGVGACSRPTPQKFLGDDDDAPFPTTSPTFPRATFTVESNSCNGCYAVSLGLDLISSRFGTSLHSSHISFSFTTSVSTSLVCDFDQH